jgi:hypothetical protein
MMIVHIALKNGFKSLLEIAKRIRNATLEPSKGWYTLTASESSPYVASRASGVIIIKCTG